VTAVILIKPPHIGRTTNFEPFKEISVFAPFADRAPGQDVFEQSLRDLSWIQGQNLAIEVRDTGRA
jgi:hypothetical protein